MPELVYVCVWVCLSLTNARLAGDFKANTSLRMRKTQWTVPKADSLINSRTVKIHNLNLLAFDFVLTVAAARMPANEFSLNYINFIWSVAVISCVRRRVQIAT